MADWIAHLTDLVRGAGASGVAMVFVLYVAFAVFMLPAWVQTLAVGSTYGVARGLLSASPASVTAATAAFLLGRTVLRGWVRRRIEKSPKARAVDRAMSRQGFWVVFLLRLSPLVPFDVLNYALSLSAIGVWPYVVASWVGMLPGTVLYLYLGSLTTVAGPQTGRWQLALKVAGLAATAGVVWLVSRAAKTALEDERGTVEGS